MAQGYISRNSAVAKTLGTTVALNVTAASGETINVAVAYDNTQGDPVVKWGTERVRVMHSKSFVTPTFTLKQYSLHVVVGDTRELKATWDSAIAARIIMADTYTEAGLDFASHANINTNNTISHSGPATIPEAINIIHVAHHLTNGPAGDLTGTTSTGYTSGQRVGTTGDAATSNITIHAMYKIVAAPLITAGSFVIGDTYKIGTLGTPTPTDYTAIGAASNTVGLVFVATGVGSGDGTAYHFVEERSRLTGLSLRDHLAVEVVYKPLQTYNLKRNFHQTWNSDWDSNFIGIVLEDENGVEAFHVRIPKSVYKNANAAERRQYIKEGCILNAARVFGVGMDVEEEDAALLIIADTYIDEKFTV